MPEEAVLGVALTSQEVSTLWIIFLVPTLVILGKTEQGHGGEDWEGEESSGDSGDAGYEGGEGEEGSGAVAPPLTFMGDVEMVVWGCQGQDVGNDEEVEEDAGRAAVVGDLVGGFCCWTPWGKIKYLIMPVRFSIHSSLVPNPIWTGSHAFRHGC